MVEKIEEYKKLSLGEIQTRIEANGEELDKIWHEDDGDDWEGYVAKCKPYWDDDYCLWTAKSMVIPKEDVRLYEMSKDDKKCRMSIKKFVEACKFGAICNSDGCGYYATEECVSDLDIFPGAACDDYVRDDFDYVCWYNK